MARVGQGCHVPSHTAARSCRHKRQTNTGRKPKEKRRKTTEIEFCEKCMIPEHLKCGEWGGSMRALVKKGPIEENAGRVEGGGMGAGRGRAGGKRAGSVGLTE